MTEQPAKDSGAQDTPRDPRPVRIEIATSEIEGGPCRAWADPSKVLAAVALSEPLDAYSQHVEQQLEDLEELDEPTEGGLPPLVHSLLRCLHGVHARLYRQNQEPSSPTDSASGNTVALTCAVGEEDRIYFVKAASSWIGLLRGENAYPVGNQDTESTRQLGSSEKLGLEVTSLPIEPDDVVVLLTSAMYTEPDLRAIASVFSQTVDLKRACDGLVNLLGLQSEGASAVAFRFVPVGPGGSSYAENPLEELAQELDSAEFASAMGTGLPMGFDAKPEAEEPVSPPPVTANVERVESDRGNAFVESPPSGSVQSESDLESVQEPATSEADAVQGVEGESLSTPSVEAQDSATVESVTDLSKFESKSGPVAESTSEPEPGFTPEPPPPAEPPVARVEDPFAEMTDAMPAAGGGFKSGTGVRVTEADESSAGMGTVPSSPESIGADAFLDSLGGMPSAPGAETPAAQETELERVWEDSTPVNEPSVGSSVEPSIEPEAAPEPELVGAAVGSDEPPAPGDPQQSPSVVEPVVADARPLPVRSLSRDRRGFPLWPVMIVLLVGMLFAMAAIPGAIPFDYPGKETIQGIFGGSVQQGETGELRIRPDPPARRVYLDGEVVAEGTPVVLDAVAAGRHRVGLDLGEFGVWETELHVGSEETNVLAPRLTGSVRIQAADPTRAGNVWVDGGERMATPATFDDLPVGWNRIFYEDEGLPIWERQVLIRTDRVAKVVVPNDVGSGEGQVKVESLTFWEGKGLEETPGDSVWVDDKLVGETPLDHRMDPGLHSIRVRSSFGESYTEMLDLHSGGTRYIVAKFGMSPRPVLHHVPPGRVVVNGSLVLTVEVESPADAQIARPTLHFPHLEGDLREIPLSQVDSGKPVFVGITDATRIPSGTALAYYFTVLGSSGETVYSDLYRLTIAGPEGTSTAIVSSTPSVTKNHSAPATAKKSVSNEAPKNSVTPRAQHSTTGADPASKSLPSGNAGGSASGTGSQLAKASSTPPPVDPNQGTIHISEATPATQAEPGGADSPTEIPPELLATPVERKIAVRSAK